MANTNSSNSLSLLTLNCQALRDPNKCTVHFSWLNCVKPDIVCLQQMHSTSKAEFDSWVAHETSSSDNIQNTQLFLLLVMLVVVVLPFYLDLFLNKILIFLIMLVVFRLLLCLF